jgi:type II secretory pathway pseudopilin PulG
MHVHLPKPLHGWRAFAGEVGIIVVGVLIALGAEQVVGSVHRAQQASNAREAVRRELEFNLARLSSRAAIRGCVDRRLTEIQTLLDGAQASGVITTPGWVGRPQLWTMQTARWDASSQAGEAALLSRGELGAFGLMYGWMADLGAEMTMEQTDWAHLRELEHLRRLTPQAVIDLDAVVQDARYRAWRVNLETGQLIEQARALHLDRLKNDFPASRSVCLPMSTARQDAIRQSAFAVGEP